MDNGLLSPAVSRQIRFEGTDAVLDGRMVVCRFHDPVSCQW
ncbi:hypothetical protein NXV13_24635 [Bacteroides ovatus]|nr:hypothetical protein [Bacteroides ovatus]